MDRRFIKERINAKTQQIIEWRRMFHSIPETGMEEYETTGRICSVLESMGITPYRFDPTGVYAYLGQPAGKPDTWTIALRADIDGLLVTEETGLPFASCHEGRMHACGHDGHIAALLGAAAILKDMEDSLTCRVKLIFQPSEENTLGAKQLIRQGALEDVDEIFGLHLFSDIPTGAISIEQGSRMAQTDRFAVTFYGKGGHAGKPHQCIDATVMAADFVMSAQTIAARQINPAEGAVVTIGSLHSGTQYNIISGQASLSGTCRSFSEETAAYLKEALEKRAHGIAGYYGGRAEVHYDLGAHPPVINDPDLSARIKCEAVKILGEEAVQAVPKMMLGEDFSWYQTRVPGVFAFAGCGYPGRENPPNHHPGFDLDEDSLPVAVGLHLAAVFSAQSRAAF